MDIRFNSDFSEAVHKGPPEYSVGMLLGVIHTETGYFPIERYIEDVEYDYDIDVTTYFLTEEPVDVPDLLALFEQAEATRDFETDEDED